jgi:hypothetical protein
LLDVIFDDDPADKVHAPIGQPVFTSQITPDELMQAYKEAYAVRWPHATYKTLKEIFTALKLEGIEVSERRKKKATMVAQAAAWLDGSMVVMPEHLGCLAHVLWNDHQEQPAKCARIVAKYANPAKPAIRQHRREAERIVETIDPYNGRAVQDACDKLEEIINELNKLVRPDLTDELIKEIDNSMVNMRAMLLKGRRAVR